MTIVEKRCIDCDRKRMMNHNAFRCYECAMKRRKHIDRLRFKKRKKRGFKVQYWRFNKRLK